jgi:hypothetical protein
MIPLLSFADRPDQPDPGGSDKNGPTMKFAQVGFSDKGHSETISPIWP